METALRGIVFPPGTRAWRDEDTGALHFVAGAALDVHGHRFAAGTHLELAAFPPPLSVVMVAPLLPLYPWFAFEELRSAVIAREVAIDPALPLRIGDLAVEPGDRVWLRRGGVVSSLLLGSPREVRGHALETGCLSFDRRGAIRSIMLYRSQLLARLPAFGSGLVGTDVRFDRDGRVRHIVLADSLERGGRTYARGTRLHLDERGRVVRAERIDVDRALYTFRPDIAARAAGPGPER